MSWLASRGHDVTVMLVRPRLGWPVELPYGPDLRERLRIAGPGLRGLPGGVVAVSPTAVAGVLSRRVLNALPGWLRNRLRRRRHGADAVLGAWIDPAAALACAGLISDMRPAAVLIDTIFRASLLRDKRLADTPSVLLAHDVFHARHAALSDRGYALRPPTLTSGEEARLLALAGTIVAIQPGDAAVLAALAPDRRVIVAGMPATPRPRPPSVRRSQDRLVFVGSDSLHNVDGLRWFCAAVWPRVRAMRPSARLDICGTAAHGVAALPEGVRDLGQRADLGPFLHRATLAIAPLRAGSGLKVKLLDYVTHGLTVVTTTVGAAGFPFAERSPLIVADGEMEFAQALVDALDASEPRREADALDYAACFGADRVFAELATALGI